MGAPIRNHGTFKNETGAQVVDGDMLLLHADGCQNWCGKVCIGALLIAALLVIGWLI
jgi:hypothetical protein